MRTILIFKREEMNACIVAIKKKPYLGGGIKFVYTDFTSLITFSKAEAHCLMKEKQQNGLICIRSGGCEIRN